MHKMISVPTSPLSHIRRWNQLRSSFFINPNYTSRENGPLSNETKLTENSPRNPFQIQITMAVYFPFLDVKSVLNLLCLNTVVSKDMKAFWGAYQKAHTRFSISTGKITYSHRLAILDHSKTHVAEELFNLSLDAANRQPLVAAGIHIQLGALLGDLKATSDSKESAAGALGNLSVDPTNLQPLVAAGVHNPLSALLRDPEATPVAKQWASRALRNLEPTPRGCCVIS